jgi:hypothetical protein
MHIEGGGREECRPEDTRNEGNPSPEIRCRPRGDEAADENGNRRGSKHPGGSYPHVLSSVLSREWNGSRPTQREARSQPSAIGSARGVAV